MHHPIHITAVQQASVVPGSEKGIQKNKTPRAAKAEAKLMAAAAFLVEQSPEPEEAETGQGKAENGQAEADEEPLSRRKGPQAAIRVSRPL